MADRDSQLARKEAARFHRIPDAFLARSFDSESSARVINTPVRSRSSWNLAAEQKPELYGRFGKFIDLVMDATFSTANNDGIPRLFRVRNRRFVEATGKDRSSWHGIQACWSDTLFANMLHVVGPNDGKDNSSMVALQALWNVRMHAIGNQRNFYDALHGDAHNAATQSIRIALGQSDFIDQTPNPNNRLRKRAVVSDSPSPLLSIAGLEMSQLELYAEQYLGESTGDRLSFTIHQRDIQSNVYRYSPNGRILLAERIEDMAIDDYGTVGAIPSVLPGAQIGCPLVLIQGAPQMLWEGIAYSMADAGQL